MKKFNNNIYFIVPLIAGLFSIQAHSEYSIQYPMEASKGGFLPDGSITFTKETPDTPPVNPPVEIGQWISSTPTYTEWSYVGDYYNCSSSYPRQEEYLISQTFEQTLSGCSRQKTRYKQEREQHTATLSFRNVGNQIEEVSTDNSLSYTRTSTGLNEIVTFNFGAGRIFYNNSSTFVGGYARTNVNVDIGAKVFNKHGHRFLVYFFKSGAYNTAGSCELRIAFTASGGWTPNGIPAGADAYMEIFKYIDFYNTDGSLYKRMTLPTGSAYNAEGAYRLLPVPCTDLSRFYTNQSIYSKAVLSIY